MKIYQIYIGNTSTYFARDINKNNIHVSNIDSIAKSKIIKTWKLNGKECYIDTR